MNQLVMNVRKCIHDEVLRSYSLSVTILKTQGFAFASPCVFSYVINIICLTCILSATLLTVRNLIMTLIFQYLLHK